MLIQQHLWSIDAVVPRFYASSMEHRCSCGANLCARRALLPGVRVLELGDVELLPAQIELHRHGRAGRTRPDLGVAADPADPGVFEDACVLIRGRVALGVEPEAGRESVVGHRSSSRVSRFPCRSIPYPKLIGQRV
jgi:hypothetical protein